MRPQADTFTTTPPESVVANAAAENFQIEANNALRDGIRAAQAGDRQNARTALIRATELDPRSESAWLWLASISDYPEELLVFLNNVLELNPLNARANEWLKATKTLLSKTFVQRGIDAADGGQNELAVQYFDQALEHDQTNTAAWFWLADLSDSNEGKISYLEKVLEFDPGNETARTAYQTAMNQINRSLLAEARSAAVAGRKSEAHELLDAFLAENPESEDGWILRSHLSDGFADKIVAFEKVLSINPGNLTARSGIDSLKAIIETVEPMAETLAAPKTDIDAGSADSMENTAFVLEQERTFDVEVVHDKHPTQELVFPVAAYEFRDRVENDTFTPAADTSRDADQEMTCEAAAEVPDPTPTKNESVDWSMATSAFTFEFPGGETTGSDDQLIAEASFESSQDAHAAHGESNFEDAFPAAVEPETGIHFEPVLDEYKPDTPPVFTDTFSFEVTSMPPVEPVSEYEPAIPMPNGHEFELVSAAPTVEQRRTVTDTQSEVTVCPFCSEENPGQAFTCSSCLAALTLADLEMLLANTHADKDVVRASVEKMEAERSSRDLSVSELITLGIGHLNLRDLPTGYLYLFEASRLDPNNVILAGQVNSLLIRLDEIKQKEESHDAMPKGRSILVVDDSATVRKLIAGKLEKCGHEVVCAADGVDAIEQLGSLTPDLVLLDINMPRMDGYQVCKVIRSNESTKDIPVVMISGKDGFFDKVRGRMAGSTGYITKPFGPETLMKAVETYLKGEQL